MDGTEGVVFIKIPSFLQAGIVCVFWMDPTERHRAAAEAGVYLVCCLQQRENKELNKRFPFCGTLADWKIKRGCREGKKKRDNSPSHSQLEWHSQAKGEGIYLQPLVNRRPRAKPTRAESLNCS